MDKCEICSLIIKALREIEIGKITDQEELKIIELFKKGKYHKPAQRFETCTCLDSKN